MKDYPAAHSMDTEWFAIDKDGNIGVVDSGENGAVPDSSYRVAMLGDLLLELAKTSKNRVLQWNISGEDIAKIFKLKKLQFAFKKSNFTSKYFNKDTNTEKLPIISEVSVITIPRTYRLLEKQILYSWLFLLASDEVISRLEIETLKDNYAVRFAGEIPLVYVDSCRLIILKQLIEEGLILAGKEIEIFSDEFHTLFGFFSYYCKYYTPCPYEQEGKPILPLKLDDLPQDLREAISQTCFNDLSFHEKTRIQPIEHFLCDTWNGTQWWVDSKGNEREGHPYE